MKIRIEFLFKKGSFRPGSGLSFRASAFGNTGTKVVDDIFRIDCNNNRNF